MTHVAETRQLMIARVLVTGWKAAALHKRDNHPRRDQGVYASKGDAEIQTAHDVLILELVLFAGYRSFPMLFVCLVRLTRETGIRSGGKVQKWT